MPLITILVMVKLMAKPNVAPEEPTVPTETDPEPEPTVQNG
jgi:hypothetical protein